MKSEILAELKRVKYKNLEDMVYRLELTYDEMVDIMDVHYIVGSTKRFKFLTGVYKITDISSMLKSLLPKDVKVTVTIDYSRLKSYLTTNKTIRFIKKDFSI